MLQVPPTAAVTCPFKFTLSPTQIFISGPEFTFIAFKIVTDKVENDALPVIGKAAIKELEKENQNGVNSFEQKIISLVIDEEKGMVMGEMQLFFDSKKYGPKKLQEAFIQHWKDEKIVYQKFYYKQFISNNGQ